MSIVSVTDGPVSSRIRNRFFQVLGPLGLRFSTIDADVKVRRGKVIGVSARATTANPEIVDDGSWLFAVIGGGGTQWPFPLAPGEVFRVMQPSGCASCKAQYAVFTPEIDRDRYLRALTLNTDCFARVHACRDPNELMPQVSARDDLSQQVTPGCDLHNLHFAAQTNLSIFVAKVNKPPTAGAAPFELVKTFAAEMQDGVAVPTGDWQVSRNSILADQGFLRKYQNVLRPGNEVIVFGSTREKQAWDTCPVAPATAENLQAVWEGIQQVHELD
jgi:hypothetical protein